ncbi:V-set and immunoglobulin domain-containing protein 8 isoform X2 [Eublepharis macularius]|uniref:V-set and immunoglobulin domain-containing protein 8 isoform X2 n=1 Tax=Eublepharis macularius TaxID=481883 RepID=UPI002410A335|nr:V-set and immunoglobulin domain-containing protein 8 isoform X2 [Eublepharis macularius]
MAGMWALQLLLLCLAPALVPAVKINAKGREVIYLAKGDSVKLGCPYELGPEDNGPNNLDIEWTQMNSDPTSLDNVILSYQGQQVIRPGYPYVQQRRGSGAQESRHFGHPGLQQNVVIGQPNSHQLGPVGSVGDCCFGLQERVNFAIPDPSQHDASINLQNVQVTDSATYECKVKKTTVATRKVTVTVLERPSVPQCSIVGYVSRGRDVTLRCSSQAGSSPLIYQWSRVGNWMPSSITKGPNPGDLVIRNLSNDHVGFYQCNVANKVGSAQCVLEISLSAGANQVGVILGAVFGSLLLLLLLVCLIAGLVCCCKRKRSKEQPNQLRVDTAPPRTKCTNRNSSLRSVLDYIPHNLSFSQRRKYDSPKEQEGIEMITQAREADTSCAVDSREDQDGGCSSVVTTKARVHYAPTVPSSSSQVKAGTSSAQSPTGTNPGNNKSSSDQDLTHGKRSHPGNYGGVAVMVPAVSRDGLVI